MSEPSGTISGSAWTSSEICHVSMLTPFQRLIARVFKIKTWEECERFLDPNRGSISMTMFSYALGYHERFFGGTPKKFSVSSDDYVAYNNILVNVHSPGLQKIARDLRISSECVYFRGLKVEQK